MQQYNTEAENTFSLERFEFVNHPTNIVQTEGDADHTAKYMRETDATKGKILVTFNLILPHHKQVYRSQFQHDWFSAREVRKPRTGANNAVG